MPNRLSVALVSPGWLNSPCVSGIITCIATARPALQRRGVRVIVLPLSLQGDSNDPDVIPLVPACRGWFLVPLAEKLIGKVAPEHARAIRVARMVLREAHRLKKECGLQLLEMEETFGWAASVAMKSCVPVVVRLHGPACVLAHALGEENDTVMRRVCDERVAIARAHGVSAPSRDTLSRVRTYYGMELKDAEVIPNPVRPVPLDGLWSLGRCDLRRILFVGRFDRCKGGDTIIDAFVKIAAVRPDCQLVFVGPDHGLSDGSGRTWNLQEFVRSRFGGAPNLAKRIQCTGALPHHEITNLRRNCSVTVVASRYETFGYTVVEAMAQGCPLVATNVGGIPEIVEDGRNGLLCRSENPGDLAEKILILLDNHELAARLGRQAALDCEARYHPDIIAEKTIDFYQRVIERWQARRGRSM